MHALLSLLALVTLVAVFIVLVAALLGAMRSARVVNSPAVAASTIKPVPVEAPAAVYGGPAKGQNFDLFGGWPKGYVPSTPAKVKVQAAHYVKVPVTPEMRAQLVADAQALGQPLGLYVRDLLQEKVSADETMHDQDVASMAGTLA